MYPVVVVGATGLDQQHAFGRVGTEAVGQQATSGARSDDDGVKRGAHGVAFLVSGFFCLLDRSFCRSMMANRFPWRIHAET
jgi:hypothetical protein